MSARDRGSLACTRTETETGLDPELLRALHRQMVRIRVVEEMLAERYDEKEMRCPVHFCIGQEAVAAGACAALAPTDYAMSTHRSHGHYLAKGGDLRAFVAELYGRATGCSGGKGGSMHVVDRAAGFLGATPIVGSTIAIATGAAFGVRMQREERVTMVFLGDGAIEEGTFHESLNFAVLKQLPIVYVCENNQYSVYTHFGERQPEGRAIWHLAAAYGVESHHGDGNDVGEVYRLSAAAVAKARSGGGPTFLELATYRLREHCGPNLDDHLGYRSEADVRRWRAACPIERVERLLRGAGIVGTKEAQEIKQALRAEMAEAIAFAQASPFPPEEQLMADVHTEARR